MRNIFKHLIRDVHPLDPENIGDKAKDVAFHVLEDRDIAFCLKIHRANESHFPVGGYDEYEKRLTNREFLTLVATRNQEAVGCCSLGYNHTKTIATLCYGMVDPAHQRQGIGTAQVLVRLASLTTINDLIIGVMFVVPGAISFYKRFKFDFSREMLWEGHPLRVGVLPLSQSFIDDCRKVLIERDILYPDIRDKIPHLPETDEAILL